jgi:diguanylate cyclase (GGDEF)-like protein
MAKDASDSGASAMSPVRSGRYVSLQVKLLAGFSVIAMVVALVGYIGTRQLGEMKQRTDDLNATASAFQENYFYTANEVARLQFLVQGLTLDNLLLYSLPTVEEQQVLVKKIIADVNNGLTTAEDLRGRVALLSPEAAVAYEEYMTALDDLQNNDGTQQTFLNILKGERAVTNPNEPVASDVATAVVATSKPAQDLLAAMSVGAKTKIDEAKATALAAEDAYNRGRMILMAASIAALVLAIAMGMFFYRMIATPVKRIVKLLRAVEDGDLKARVYIENNDELGRLGDKLNTTVASLERHTQELSYRALHDVLTGLPNRALLLAHLEKALAGFEREAGLIAILAVDLDRFKHVNDSFGHTAGDDVLVTVSERLLRVVRPTDTVARFEGNEFMLLLDPLGSPADAVVIGERVIEALGFPFQVGDSEVYVGASIGVALANSSEMGADQMLRNADAALHRAKGEASSKLVFFDEELRQKIVDRLRTETELRRAIANEELCLHFQPEVSLVDGKILSVEALVRWNHPERGLLAAGLFVPLAEENGLIVPIGNKVLDQACVQLGQWKQQGMHFKMRVNLSPWQVAQTNLPQLVEHAIRAGGIEPHDLCLEITETTIMSDVTASLQMLDTLKEIGVTLAIDDFGTGYSSLAYLKRFPVDVLKIDKSFVDNVHLGIADQAIVAATVSLAETLQLELTAEGVEYGEQADALLTLGVDRAQGFFFARPVPPETVEEYWGADMRTRVGWAPKTELGGAPLNTAHADAGAGASLHLYEGGQSGWSVLPGDPGSFS